MAYSAISKSSSYFNTKIYTGTGSSNALTGVGFQPDWTWIKSRSNSYSHTLTDAIRGYTKHNASNNSNAEYTSTTEITSFNSDGFTLGTDAGVNNNGSTFASWNWKANGSGSANGDGDINSTVSVNTTSGFSIVSYTGNGSTATVGHGLGVVPKVIIIKCTSNTGNWQFYHEDIGNNKKLILNTNAAEASSGFMNNTSPTSSVFTVINDVDVGQNGYTYIAYCFADIQGYSKFGSYTGNQNTDGPFIYTGFRPSMIIIKKSSGTGDWMLFDNKREGYNPDNDALNPNLTDTEGTTDYLNLLSNGFKIKTVDGLVNDSGNTYIFMASGQPTVSTNGDIATAR